MTKSAVKTQDKPNGIKSGYCLAPLTTFRIGGNAEYFLEAKTQNELKEGLIWAKSKHLPVFLIGSGSNLLISDNGVKGLVIKLAGKFSEVLSKTKSKSQTENQITAGGAVKLSQLIQFCRKNNLGGLEFLASVPGTAGGAVCMNAGAFGKSLGQFVDSVETISFQGQTKRLSEKLCRFGYRSSAFQRKKLIVTSVTLKIPHESFKDDQVSQQRILRHQTQPWGFSAGSVFKNPKGNFAGALIEKAGLKGYRIGEAKVSEKHANFILNTKDAGSDDVYKLIKLIQKKVKSKFKINLQLEIKLLGRFN